MIKKNIFYIIFIVNFSFCSMLSGVLKSKSEFDISPELNQRLDQGLKTIEKGVVIHSKDIKNSFYSLQQTSKNLKDIANSGGYEITVTSKDLSNISLNTVEFNISNWAYLNALLLAFGISGIYIVSQGIKKYGEDSDNGKYLKDRGGGFQMRIGGLMALISTALLFAGPKNLWAHFFQLH